MEVTPQPAIRIKVRPEAINPRGDVFGGWLMGQMDIAASIIALKRAKGRVATVAVKEIRFLHALLVDDVLSFYTKIIKTGRSSITVEIEVHAERGQELGESTIFKAASGTFVFAAIEDIGKLRPLPAE